MRDEPLLVAIPSKGRLHDAAVGFFARAGLPVSRAGSDRAYRGTIEGLAGVEVVFLSASEIATVLAAGGVHFGLTGLDLLHETVDDAGARAAAFHLVTPLGFGAADVVVAVPNLWIDVSTMADLADVATDFRARHGRALRVATKFFNLTRRHFGQHGIADYRIVESLGATEGAPAAGAAELIVDITTTGATLAANDLKILDDGMILASEAQFVAALKADWTPPALLAARTVLDRLAAELRAREIREVRAVLAEPERIGRAAVERYGCALPFGAEAAPLTLHCPRKSAYDCAAWLKDAGADTVVIADVSDVFEPSNTLATALDEALAARS